jgi:hypothetical protein
MEDTKTTEEVFGEQPPLDEEAMLPEPTTQYRRSLRLDALFAALAKAQGQFESAEKTRENAHFHSKYTTLETVMEATREGRKANGLAVIQMPVNQGDEVAVITLLGHSSGQWIESTLSVTPAQYTAQGVGSVVTYFRRYALMSMLGIVPEDDDDGNAAVGRRPAEGTQPAGRVSLNPDRACPACGNVGSMILNRATRQWVCWRSKGGCEASFDEDDARVTGKAAGNGSAKNPPAGEASEEREQVRGEKVVATEEQLRPLLNIIGLATDPRRTTEAILARCGVAKLAELTAEQVIWQTGELEKKLKEREGGNKRPPRSPSAR